MRPRLPGERVRLYGQSDGHRASRSAWARKSFAANGLAQMYFRANNSRAHGLGVEFTDVEHIQIDL
ncbi:hypothetical protein ACIRP2_39350 [Streptomyces sp. NPDC101194]|uniref:hypothetical protein n=1 Tax=Streptomyces sp. NPDC101194 TaxID=3366127 RepID=UPI003821D463